MQAEAKICGNCQKEFEITNEDSDFYEKLGMSLPNECVQCRWERLLSFWSFGRFRKTQSSLSSKGIITVIPESVPFPIYSREEWASDTWDGFSYGKNYDFSKSFFEQFGELRKEVPIPHQVGIGNLNCDWCDDVWESKNCYLCRSIWKTEDSSYGYRIFGCKNSIDIAYCYDTELSYDCLYCFKCYKVRHAFDTHNSLESMFLYDCKNVQNCFLCWNLRSKKYCILNQQYTKEEYFEKLKQYNTRSWRAVEKLKKQLKELVTKEAIHKANFNLKVTNSSGDFLVECKNCVSCYFLEHAENCRHCFRGAFEKDTVDTIGSGNMEKCALGVIGLNCYETVATVNSSNTRYSRYCMYCENCENCFGCIGLKNKSHCILNKQYIKEEYEKLFSKIKEQMVQDGTWGQFFPYILSYAPYNLSLAHICFPLSKSEVERRGGFWEEDEAVQHEGISGNDVPDVPDSVASDFPTQAIICPITKRRFNVSQRELEFCKQQGVPLPHHHPDWRTLNRFGPLSIAARLHTGNCYFCKKEISYSYPPEWNYQKISCVECYRAQVI